MNDLKTKGLPITICSLCFQNLCLACHDLLKHICGQQSMGKSGADFSFWDRPRRTADREVYTILEGEFRVGKWPSTGINRNKLRKYSLLPHTSRKIWGSKMLRFEDIPDVVKSQGGLGEVHLFPDIIPRGISYS